MAETLAARAVISRESSGAPLHWCAGFFLATRMMIVYLGFQSDARMGTAMVAALGVCVLLGAVAFSMNKKNPMLDSVRGAPTLRWMNAYLAFTGASLLWTQAESRAVAGVYWVGVVIDAATVVLLLRGARIHAAVEGLMRGFVMGSILVAVVAWCAPTLPDMRIGHEEFLHPNALGLEFALGFFLAQHLSVDSIRWRWAALALGASLLRTISKTSIAACLVAELFYLLCSSQISRKAKLRAVAGMALTIAVFSGLLQAYLDRYISNTNELESLTGRTAVWTMSVVMGMEQPWLGHGFYSFRALVPSFGVFQAWTAHNELLQQFFESGMVGVSLTVGLYVSLWRAALGRRASAYGLLAATLVVFCLVHGLTDAANFGLTLPFWLLVALMAALNTERSKEEASV